MTDYYKVLGVPKEATPSQIKKAYRDLAKKYHPDKAEGDISFEDKFKKINEAYETLSDENKKAAYDNPHRHSGFTTGYGVDVEEMFRQHFGGGFSSPRQRTTNIPRRGRDLKLADKVTLYQVLTKAKKEINLSYDEPCPECDGTAAAERSVCSDCNGSGIIQQFKEMGAMRIATNGPCMACRGTGFKIVKKCPSCNGGIIRTNRKFTYEIPPTANNGTVLKYSGDGGNGSHGGPKGDLYIKLNLVLPTNLTEEQKEFLKELS